ncbi:MULTISPECIES: lysophospholipid acyltransferase family protein [Frankia]|uniref:lysophospholipid acyltransferase family protein n=1 Tax=Frankia TaxID=1854 RepID=UPI0012FFBCFF
MHRLNGARPSRAKRPTSRPGPTDRAAGDPAAVTDPATAATRDGTGSDRTGTSTGTGRTAADRTGGGRTAAGRTSAGRTAGDRASSGPGATARQVPRISVDGGAASSAEDGTTESDRGGFEAGDLETALAGVLAFLRRRITGDYVVDEHGFDPDLTEHVIAPLLRPVYRDYFRVETRGLENIPDVGGALVVANHSGTLPMDALMMAMAILDHHPAHRNLRMLAADLVFAVPFLAPLARKIGNTLACQADAERLLTAGHLVGVWPEGFKGVGKPFSERYTLQRFGRGGFVSAALRTGVPIIPCTVVGAEEIYPMIGNAKSLARLLGLPYLPITPTFPWLGLLGLIPLPSKWIIEFGEPVPTDSYPAEAADDPMLVFELTDRIRETIQHTLYSLLMQRRSVFF